MSSSFPSSRKHALEPSCTPAEDNRLVQAIECDESKPKRKRKRADNERRKEKKRHRVDRYDTSKSLESLELKKDVEDDQSPVSRGRTMKPNRDRAPSPTSPKRPTISPTSDTDTAIPPQSYPTLPIPTLISHPTTTTSTTDPLSFKLARVTHLISTDNLQAAYKLLLTITRTNDWQPTATRDSILQIYNYTQLLGDGKKQCIQQAKIINDARRKESDTESEIKGLVRDITMLRMERRR